MTGNLGASFILAMAILIGQPVTSAQADYHHHKRECRYQFYNERSGWTDQEVKLTIRCVSAKFNINLEKAMYVADRESHFQEGAVNRISGACGVYQHMPQYFPSRLVAVEAARPRFRRYREWCLNPRANIFAALWMVHRYGWSAWSTA